MVAPGRREWVVAIQGATAYGQAVPYVDTRLCDACHGHPARGVCRGKALMQFDPGKPPLADGDRCYGCNACLQAYLVHSN